MRAKALILGMVLTLCVSADTPAADLGAINIQNNIETIGNNISVLNKDLNVTKLQKKTVKKKNKKKTKLSEIDKYKKKIFINHLYTLRQEVRKMERINKIILISCVYAGYICISFALFSMLR